MKKISFILLTVVILFSCSKNNDLTNKNTDSHFYFVQVTDTHIGSNNHSEILKTIVDIINKIPFPVEFVALTGDITMNKIYDKNVVSETKKILSKLNYPVYYVPGNHDIQVKMYEDNSLTYQKEFSDLIYYKDFNGVRCIFIYTEPLTTMFQSESLQRITPLDKNTVFDPLSKIKEVLSKSDDMPILIFNHSPSVEDFYYNETHDTWQADSLKKWNNIITKYNVKGIISGHFHRDQLNWTGDIPLYICPSVATYLNRQPAFRIYEYNNGKISYITRYIE